MKRKRIIALALCICLAALTACSGSNDQTAAATEVKPAETTVAAAAQAETQAAEKEPSAEPVKLTIGIVQNSKVENYDTNNLTKYLEDRTGYDLDFVYFSSDQTEAATQLALMLSSGEKLPDLLTEFALPTTQVFEYGEAGYFIDIRDYLENSMPNFKSNLEYMIPEDLRANVTSYGVDPKTGAIYGFPYFSVSNNTLPFFASINSKWLEAVGEKCPETVDELYTVLQKFKNEDPNGNGKADEIPMLSYNGDRGDITQWIVNAFVFCNDMYFWNVDNGNVWCPYTTEEYRQAMIYLNKLVSEGLLSDLSFTIGKTAHDEVMALFTPPDGTAVTGIVGGQPDLTIEADNMLVCDYEGTAPLKAETSLGGFQPVKVSIPSYTTYITKDCQNVEAAVALCDLLYTPESFATARYGPEGKGWEWMPEGSTDITVFGERAEIRILDNTLWAAQNNDSWHSMNLPIFGNSNRFNPIFEDDGSFSYYKLKLFNSFYTKWAQAPKKGEIFTEVIYTEEENEAVAEIKTPMTDYIKESRALFATGAMDPNSDSDWQNYLDSMESLGLSQWQAAAQAAYSRLTK